MIARVRPWWVPALAGATLATGAALGFVALRGPTPAHSLDDRVHEVASTLRCPVCLDLSVADSPSIVARQMRARISRRLRAGESPAEVRAFFVSRFGRSILLTPGGSGVDLLAWIVPALLIAGGLLLLVAALLRWSRRPPAAPAQSLEEPSGITAVDRELLERELRGTEEAEWA